MAKVVYRWVLFQGARLAVFLLTRLLWLPMRLLETLCEALEDAQIEWLLANTNRRLDARKRLNLVNQIEPLPGTFPSAFVDKSGQMWELRDQLPGSMPAALKAHGHDGR